MISGILALLSTLLAGLWPQQSQIFFLLSLKLSLEFQSCTNPPLLVFCLFVFVFTDGKRERWTKNTIAPQLIAQELEPSPSCMAVLVHFTREPFPSPLDISFKFFLLLVQDLAHRWVCSTTLASAPEPG